MFCGEIFASALCCFYFSAQFFTPLNSHLEIAFCENAVQIQIMEYY